MDPDSNVLTHVFNREVDYLQIADKNRDDIATFVSTTLENTHRLSSIMATTQSAKEDILTKMNQKSSGMYVFSFFSRPLSPTLAYMDSANHRTGSFLHLCKSNR
jgi:hypothetical protein